MYTRQIIRLFAALVLLMGCFSQPVEASSSTVTYTGQLLLPTGVPLANNHYDLQFTPYNTPSGGSVLGSTLTLTNVPVYYGVFYAELNFGTVINGQSIYVQTAYRVTGTSSYTLEPSRKAVLTSAYSVQSGYSFNAANTVRLQNVLISTTKPTTGQVLAYNGSIWAPTASGGLTLPYSGSASSSSTLFSVTNTGNGNGIDASSTSGVGVLGNSTGSDGVQGDSASSSASGVAGVNTVAGGMGVYGINRSSGDYGTLGGTESLSGNNYPTGVFGYDASGEHYGVFGYSSDGDAVYGNSSTRTGVLGFSSSGTGVVGSTSTGTAGLFYGNVTVSGDLSVGGTLTKNGGSFKIDSPLDPANKFLSHSFVESPDMMNIYNGNVRTNAHGRATVTMPAYFGALNQDFRYQLTVIGQFAQAIVGTEIAGNHFTIKTDKPYVKVSWMVTGIRHDAWANAHRIPTEELKPVSERGLYLDPVDQGKPVSMGIGYAKQQKMQAKN